MPDPSPEPPAAPETVHLATAWDDETAKNIRHATVRFIFRPLSIGGEALALACHVLVVAAMIAFDPYFSLAPMGTILVLLLVFALMFLVIFLFRRDPEHFGSPEFPPTSDPGARLRVVAHAKLLRLFNAAPLALDAPFEPAIFRITYALEPALARNFKLIASALAGIALMVLVEYLANPIASGAGVMWLYCGLAIGRFSRPFVWPTYLRLVPGRLDVLQYPFLGLGTPRVRSYDLRNARLSIQLGAHFAVFPNDTDIGELLPAPQSAFNARHHAFPFERALLSAALSPFPAAPLPKDELVG